MLLTGDDRPCTDVGYRWSDGYEATTINATSFGVTRAVAEQVIASRARQRRRITQELLDAGIAAATARRSTDAQLSELRWEGDTLVHETAQAAEADGNFAGEKITPLDGIYVLPGSWAWHVVDRELVDVVHGEH